MILPTAKKSNCLSSLPKRKDLDEVV